jgi:hypothetical protein
MLAKNVGYTLKNIDKKMLTSIKNVEKMFATFLKNVDENITNNSSKIINKKVKARGIFRT